MWNFLSSGCIQRSAVTYSISLHQSHRKTPREKCRLFFALPVKRYLKAHPFFFWKRGILVQCKEWISRRIQKRRKKNSISGWYTSYHTPRWLSFTCSCTVLSHHRTHGISARPFFPATFIPANTTRCEVRSWMREKKTQDRISTRMHSTSIPPPTSAQDRAPLLARLR